MGEGLGVEEEGRALPLTNEFQRQDTVWHCPLDIVVTSGCVVISSEKVGLGEGKSLLHITVLLFLFLLSLFLDGLSPPAHSRVVLSFQAYATRLDLLIFPFT